MESFTYLLTVIVGMKMHPIIYIYSICVRHQRKVLPTNQPIKSRALFTDAQLLPTILPSFYTQARQSAASD